MLDTNHNHIDGWDHVGHTQIYPRDVHRYIQGGAPKVMRWFINIKLWNIEIITIYQCIYLAPLEEIDKTLWVTNLVPL